MPEIAGDEPPAVAVLEEHRAADRAWLVTVDVGFRVLAGRGVGGTRP